MIKQTMGNATVKLLLLIILLAAVALRLAGLRWGLPDQTHLFSYHPDEYYSLAATYNLCLGSLNPGHFNYGNLYQYLVAAACVLASGSQITGDPPAAVTPVGLPQALRAFTLEARFVTVILALLGVFVVWKLGCRVGGARVGLLSAAFVALFPTHVINSHYATVDVCLTLFVAWSLLLAVAITQGQDSWKTYLWAGIASGLAMSSKYPGGLALLAPIGAHFLTPANDSGFAQRLRSARWLLLPLGLVIGFVCTSPFVILDWQRARYGLLDDIGYWCAGSRALSPSHVSGWLFHLKGMIIGFGLPCLLLALVGAVWVACCRRQLLPLLLFCAAWFSLIASLHLHFQRYELPLAPGIALFAAMALDELWREGRRAGRVAVALATTLILSLCLWTSAGYVKANFVDAHRKSRDEMFRILTATVPRAATLGIVWEPWFNIAPVDYCNGGIQRGNIPWSYYARPLCRLVVTGLNAQRLLAELPDYYLLGEYELNEELYTRDQDIPAFLRALFSHYTLIATDSGALQPVRWSASAFLPSDWMYPVPRQWLYARRDRAQLSRTK